MQKQILFIFLVSLIISCSGAKMKSNSNVAMIMIENKKIISEADIKSYVKKDWPDLPQIKNFDGKDGTSVFDIGNYHIGISTMPMPVPSQDLEYPINTAMFWKNANNEINKHKNHIIVFVSSTDKNISIFDINITLVKIIKSISENINAIGIYWGNSSQVISTKTFISYTDMMKDNNYPIPIWVKVTGYQKENKNFYMYTVGLNSFGHREFEIKDYNKGFNEAYFFLLDMANYVLQNGPVIKNNDTVGSSETEKIKAKYKKLDINKKIDAISFQF